MLLDTIIANRSKVAGIELKKSNNLFILYDLIFNAECNYFVRRHVYIFNTMLTLLHRNLGLNM